MMKLKELSGPAKEKLRDRQAIAAEKMKRKNPSPNMATYRQCPWAMPGPVTVWKPE